MGSSTGMLLSYEIIRLTSNSKDETVLIEPFIIYIMNLEIYKDERNTGKYHHKVPNKTGSSTTKHIVLKEISKYIAENDDLGEFNYLGFESRVTTKLNPYTTYVYEDLY